MADGSIGLAPFSSSYVQKYFLSQEKALIPIAVVSELDVFQSVLFLCKAIQYRITPTRGSTNFFCYFVHHVPSLTMLVQI